MGSSKKLMSSFESTRKSFEANLKKLFEAYANAE